MPRDETGRWYPDGGIHPGDLILTGLSNGVKAWHGDVLVEALLAAVPLYQTEYEGAEPDWLVAEAKRCGQIILGETGASADRTFGENGQSDGGAARFADALARSIACMTLVHPAGFVFLAHHWRGPDHPQETLAVADETASGTNPAALPERGPSDEPQTATGDPGVP
jgi:hypothetical protein